MARMKLTHRLVESLTTDKAREDFWDALTPGLVLRVSGTGRTRTWFVRYRVGGRRRRLKLGRFPRLSLADARAAAREALAAADRGEDPAGEREDRRAGRTTFAALTAEVLEKRAERTREATRVERQRMADTELLPVWGDRPASEITRRDVVLLVERIAERAPVVANRVLSLVHLIFNDGIRRGFPGIEANPAHLVEPPGQEGRRERYLDAPEIRKVWHVLETETAIARGAFRLALLTGQRIGSVCALRWEDVEDGVWTIPAEVFKGGRLHLVPLSELAGEVLEELRSQRADDVWVFPSREGTRHPHVSNLSGSTLQRVRRASGLDRWTLHDLRRTFRTHATRAEADGGLGIRGDVADAVLGHKDSRLGVDRYTGDVARYLLHEKREALQAYGEWVRGVVS